MGNKGVKIIIKMKNDYKTVRKYGRNIYY